MFTLQNYIFPLEYAGILVSLFFFGLGSYYDFRTREVDNWLWFAYGSIGLILTIARLALDSSTLFLTVVSIVTTLVISLGLFYFGLFGGADAKAIICLGLTLPLPPTAFHAVLGYFHPLFPLVVIVLSFICSASLALWFCLRNLAWHAGRQPIPFQGLEHETKWKKAMALVTGYPVDQSTLHSTFYLYPIEAVEQNSRGFHRSLKLFVNAESDRETMLKEFDEGLSKLGYQGKVWVTPGLPMLFFILIGLVLALVLGDLVFAPIISLATR